MCLTPGFIIKMKPVEGNDADADADAVIWGLLVWNLHVLYGLSTGSPVSGKSPNTCM